MKSVLALGPAVLLMILAGCAALAENPEAAKDCEAESRYYFPADDGDSPVSGLDEFHCNWFSGHLRSMHEPPLPERAHTREARAYRLLVLPTFESPHAMRLETDDAGSWRLVERATNGRGGYDPGRVIFKADRILTKEETAGVEAAVAALDFDKMATEPNLYVIDPVTGDERIILIGDGTTLVFEAVRAGHYRVFHRPWSKSVLEPEFERLVHTFLDLSAHKRQTGKSEKSD